jgi:hypothetical protein
VKIAVAVDLLERQELLLVPLDEEGDLGVQGAILRRQGEARVRAS